MEKPFDFAAAFLQMRKELDGRVEAARAERKRLLAMTAEELCALDDGALREAIRVRIEAILDERLGEEDDVAAELRVLEPALRCFYVLDLYDCEVQNGGLCQFFVNTSRAVAPLVGKCLGAVGAEAHRSLYDGFLRENRIDMARLSAFRRGSFAAMHRRYPFDAFDRAFRRLAPLEEALLGYVRAHAEAF